MRALIVTFGTEGDVRPMTALGAALMEAGHAVRFLATADTTGAAQALGIPTVALPGAVRAPLTEAGTTGNANSAAALVRVVNDNTSAWLKLTLEHGADCDVVVAGGLSAFFGFSAAEKLGVPGVGAAAFPITPTAAFASPFFPPGAPGWANRLTHRLANGLVWRSFARATNAARQEAGLSTGRRVWTDNPGRGRVKTQSRRNLEAWSYRSRRKAGPFLRCSAPSGPSEQLLLRLDLRIAFSPSLGRKQSPVRCQ
jgi:sterol 3beta-glucosyltransferase